MLDSALSLVWFALLVGLCYGIGRFVLPPASWGGKTASFLERFLFAVPIGMGVVSFVMLALGLLRLFIPPVFYTILALGVPGWVLLVRDAVAAKSAATAEPSPRSLLAVTCGALFVLLAGCTLIAALAPPGGLEWDALSYHLTVPKTYLREHRIFYIPYDHHSNFPFLLQMLYTLMLGVGSVGGAKLCHWFCGVLLSMSVYTFAVRIWAGETGKRIGLIAAVLIAASPIVLWESSVAYVDLATALFTWLAVYLLIVDRSGLQDWPPQPPNNGGSTGVTELVANPVRSSPHYWGAGGANPGGVLLLSAILMGFAIGTKLTVLGFWAIAIAGFASAGILRERRITIELVKQVVLWGVISLALAAPWLLRSYFYTGSPVYPYFYNIFGGRYWNNDNAAQYAADQATLGLGKDPLFLLLAPWLMTVPPTAQKFNEYGFAFIPALVPLLLAAPFKPGKFRGVSVALALFSVFGYLFWFFLVQQTRYFVPMLPAVALLAAETFVVFWESGKGPARFAGAALIVASALWGAFIAASGLAVPAIRVVLGTESRSDYVASSSLLKALMPACDWINANTPKTDKVALFDEVLGFYIDRPILWATPNHAYNLIPWDSYTTVDDWLADFKRRGYTTLLVNEANAPKADSPLITQKWREFIPEAVAAGKLTEAFSAEGSHGRFVRVYRIP